MSVWNNTFIPPNFRTLRSKSSVERLPWVVALVIAFFLLLWEQAGTAAALRSAAATLTQPSVDAAIILRNAQYDFSQWWQFTQRGAEQLARLEKEVMQQQVDATLLQTLQIENAALREQVGRPQSTEHILAEWYGSERHWFVDVGCADGVSEDALVTTDGAFVGMVDTVFPEYSSVRTWQDPSWRLAAKVGTESAYGVFSFGRSIPEVEEVPLLFRERLLDANVRTAGQDAVPANYLLGTVQEVQEEPEFGTVRLIIDPAVQYSELLFVRVETQEENTCL